MKHKHNTQTSRTVLAAIAAWVVAFCAIDAVFAEDYPPRYRLTVGKTDTAGSSVPRKKRDYRPIAPVSLNLDSVNQQNIQKVAVTSAPTPNRYVPAPPPAPAVPVASFNPYYSGSRIVPPPIPALPVEEPGSAVPSYPEFTSVNSISPPPIPNYTSEPELVLDIPESEPEPAPEVKKEEPKKSSSRSSYSKSSSTRGRSSSSSNCRT